MQVAAQIFFLPVLQVKYLSNRNEFNETSKDKVVDLLYFCNCCVCDFFNLYVKSERKMQINRALMWKSAVLQRIHSFSDFGRVI